MIIGIDIGGTTTKLIGFRENEILHPLTVKADDPIASAAGALGKFVTEEACPLSSVRHIAITGVGSGRIAGQLLGLPVRHVDEFEAIGRGGSFLAQTSDAIVVSIGTGTALVEVNANAITRWGGSGIGGGTLVGLSKRLLGMTDLFLVSQKAQHGRLERIDLTVGDIATGDIPGLSHTMTASNFGKCRDDATDADLALAILNLIYQTVGVVAHGAVRATHKSLIVVTGKLATLPQAPAMFAELSALFNVTFTIPSHAAYATAIGAALATTGQEGGEKRSS